MGARDRKHQLADAARRKGCRRRRHFREQADGDLVEDGVCGLLIAEKLGVSAPTVSGHMRVLTAAKLVRAKRIKQWTMYKRN